MKDSVRFGNIHPSFGFVHLLKTGLFLQWGMMSNHGDATVSHTGNKYAGCATVECLAKTDKGAGGSKPHVGHECLDGHAWIARHLAHLKGPAKLQPLVHTHVELLLEPLIELGAAHAGTCHQIVDRDHGWGIDDEGSETVLLVEQRIEEGEQIVDAERVDQKRKYFKSFQTHQRGIHLAKADDFVDIPPKRAHEGMNGKNGYVLLLVVRVLLVEQIDLCFGFGQEG